MFTAHKGDVKDIKEGDKVMVTYIKSGKDNIAQKVTKLSASMGSDRPMRNMTGTMGGTSGGGMGGGRPMGNMTGTMGGTSGGGMSY